MARPSLSAPEGRRTDRRVGAACPRREGPRGAGGRWGGVLAPLVLLALSASLAAPGRPPAPGPLGPGGPPGGATERDEYEVKAVFLLKFLSFVEWPEGRFEDEGSPVVIGVLGRDPFGAKLDDALRGARLGKRPILPERIDGLADAGRCHVLFVSPHWKGPEEALFDEAEKESVLVVGEVRGFAARGASINFYLHEDRVRFEINVQASKRARLEISSKLLKLARIVEDQR